MDSGDNAWILASSALVLLMTPGLAFFYSGLAGRSNALATILHSFIIFALISVVWVLWGYTIAFGPDVGSIVGGFDYFGLRGVGMDPGPYSGTRPQQTCMAVQMMFAFITPALITGAMVGRIKFKSCLIFIVLWSTIVYSPLAHWVWGGGWLGNLDVLGLAGLTGSSMDFAGGTVVHISSGVSALAAALVLGRRNNYGR